MHKNTTVSWLLLLFVMSCFQLMLVSADSQTLLPTDLEAVDQEDLYLYQDIPAPIMIDSMALIEPASENYEDQDGLMPYGSSMLMDQNEDEDMTMPALTDSLALPAVVEDDQDEALLEPTPADEEADDEDIEVAAPIESSELASSVEENDNDEDIPVSVDPEPLVLPISADENVDEQDMTVPVATDSLELPAVDEDVQDETSSELVNEDDEVQEVVTPVTEDSSVPVEENDQDTTVVLDEDDQDETSPELVNEDDEVQEVVTPVSEDPSAPVEEDGQDTTVVVDEEVENQDDTVTTTDDSAISVEEVEDDEEPFDYASLISRSGLYDDGEDDYYRQIRRASWKKDDDDCDEDEKYDRKRKNDKDDDTDDSEDCDDDTKNQDNEDDDWDREDDHQKNYRGQRKGYNERRRYRRDQDEDDYERERGNIRNNGRRDNRSDRRIPERRARRDWTEDEEVYRVRNWGNNRDEMYDHEESGYNTRDYQGRDEDCDETDYSDVRGNWNRKDNDHGSKRGWDNERRGQNNRKDSLTKNHNRRG